MNYIIANGICCCLQCCCKEVFQTIYKLVGKTSFIKTMYAIVYFAFVGILLGAFVFLRDWPFFMSYFAQGIHCSQAEDIDDCITTSLVYRIVTSLGFFIIFLLIILSLCTFRVSHILNQGLFFSKFVIITIIFIILLQFNNSLFQNLSSFYQYGSYLFLVCQVFFLLKKAIIIVDVGYLWGIRWARKYSEGQDCKYSVLLILFTVGMFGVAAALNIAGYVIVSHEIQHVQALGLVSECSNLPNILNTVLILLCIGVQLLNFNKQNSLLTTSFICIYISFWCFSSIYSSTKCNFSPQLSLLQQDSQRHYEKSEFYLVGTIISIFWLLLSTFGSIFGSTNKIQDPQLIEEHQQVEYIQLGENHDQNTKNILQHRKNQQSLRDSAYYTGENKRSWLIWHFFMLTMVVYLSMVLTDWGSGNLITKKYSLNQNSYWSKILMALFAFLIYIWTLLAPRIFPDRNFYFV